MTITGTMIGERMKLKTASLNGNRARARATAPIVPSTTASSMLTGATLRLSHSDSVQ